MLSRHILALAFFCPILAQGAIPIGPAQTVTARIPGIAAGRQDDAVVATSGRETLIAWRDEATGRAGVYVAALAADGTVATGKQRWLFAPHASSVAITWTGQSYLVVWLSSSPSATWAMTIDAELRTLTPARTIHDSGGILSNIAWSGSRGAVMSGRTLLILDDDGRVVAQDDDVLERLSPFENARVAASNDAFAVFAHFREQTSILFARRYTIGGEALDAHPVQIAQIPRISDDWDVAFGGGHFALVVTEFAPFSEGTHDLWRFIVDPATLQARQLGALTIGASSGAHVEWIGDRFLAPWLDRYPQVPSLRTGPLGEGPPWGVYSLRMLPFTDDSDSPIIFTPDRFGVAVNPEEAWTGTSLTVAYTRTPAERQGRDIYSETFDWTTGRATPSAVPMSMQWQSLSAGATNGSTSLFAWLEGDPRTDTARLAATGVIAGNSGPVIYLSDQVYAVPPVVVSTDSMYLVFWLQIDQTNLVPAIAMQRLSPEGTPLDATPTVIAYGFSIAAAWNGTHVAAVWEPYGVAAAHVARLTADGQILESVPIVIPAELGGPPQIASNGTDFMVVLPQGADGEFPLPDLIDLHAARMSAAGSAEASFPVAIGPANQRIPSIASDGRDYVIAYLESTEATGDAIVTKKVLREGVLSGTTADAPGTLLAETSPWPGTPSIAAAGTGYFVTWDETDNSLTSAAHLASLDRDGAPTEPPVLVAEHDIDYITPTIVSDGGRTAHLVYSLLENDPVYGASMRLFVRQLGERVPKRRSVRR